MKTPFRRAAAAPTLGAGLILALVSGCATNSAPPAVVTHTDPAVNYERYRTFALTRPPALASTRNAALTPRLARQVRADTALAFLEHGLAAATDDSADLLVLVHGGIAEKVDLTDWGLTYGRFGRGFAGNSGRYEIERHQEGTLTIDVFDAQTKELIWRGSAAAEVDGQPKPERVRAAIAAIVAKFPH